MIGKPVYILSGFSGTGKSTLCELAKRFGIKVLRSFTKYMLSERFGDGSPGYLSLVKDSYMQVRHVMSFLGTTDISMMVERSVIDAYFFHRKYHEMSQEDEKYMRHIIGNYFLELTNTYNKPLYIIDIYNLDRDWISKVLSESEGEFRRYVNDSVDRYLENQSEYKNFFFSTLNDLDISYHTESLKVLDANKFTDEFKINWLYKLINSNYE